MIHYHVSLQVNILLLFFFTIAPGCEEDTDEWYSHLKLTTVMGDTGVLCLFVVFSDRVLCIPGWSDIKIILSWA